MERLTGRHETDGQAWYKDCKECGLGIYGDYCVECELALKQCRKLADYEDTGCTPDEIEKMKHELENLRNEVEYHNLMELQNYERHQHTARLHAKDFEMRELTRQEQDSIDAYLDSISTRIVPAKWISVDKQLPPIGEMVITKDQWDHVESGCYTGNATYSGHPEFENDRSRPDIRDCVEWWMPDPPITD